MTYSSQRVNYDQIAHLYDEPGRDYDADPNLVEFLHERADLQSPLVHILDTGCGTGKQLTSDHNRFPEAQMIGLDLFRGMLEQARRRCMSIQWIQGDSTNPPFTYNSFDYITSQFSYHHVQDKNRLMISMFQILKPKGRFVITNLDPWSMPQWLVYTCFPSTKKRDLSDFLPIDQLTSLMEKTGFCNIHVKYRHNRSEENLGDFLHYASQRHRTSQLMMIGQSDYDSGIAELKERVAQLGTDSRVSSETCLVWIIGNKPA